jgi:hypothetical protein
MREDQAARDEIVDQRFEDGNIKFARIEGLLTGIGMQVGVRRAPEHIDDAVRQEAAKVEITRSPLGLWRAGRAIWAFAAAGAAGAGAWKLIVTIVVAVVPALHKALLEIAG